MAQTTPSAARWAARLGAGGAAAFVVGPLLAHMQIVPAIVGFVLFDVGGLLGVIAVVLGIFASLRHGLGTAGWGLALGAAVTIGFFVIASSAGKFPRINDISTDTVNPPQFLRAGSLPGNQGRDMRYPGASFADQQRAGYPNLTPLRLIGSADDVFARVLAAAKQMPDWEITRVDASAHALEGVATSHLFRFRDDFVVEVRPQDGSSLVQMRSKSRDGKGDIGANAARIQAFYAKLK